MSAADFHIRPFRPEDVDGAYELQAAWEEEIYGEPELTHGMFANLASIADRGYVAERPPEMVGVAFIRGEGVDLLVRRSQRRQGIGTRLLRAVEEAASAKTLTLASVEFDPAAAPFLEANGYSRASEFWLMSIELEGEPPAPVWPDGMSARTFQEDDARAVKKLLDESYAAEPHHEPLPFDDWCTFMLGDPSYDPSVWFLAFGGEQIIGAALNWKEGYVKDLVVHPDWRGRGVGKALMLQTFREFAGRGIARIALKTDSTNPTQAWRFYEHLGMRKERTYEVWEKRL